MKPTLKKHNGYIPNIDCDNCGETIKDGSRIMEEEDVPTFPSFIEFPDATEPSSAGTHRFCCEHCGTPLHSLMICVLSDPQQGKACLDDVVFEKSKHQIYEVSTGNLKWYVDHFTDVPFAPLGSTTATKKIAWLDVHRIGGFMEPSNMDSGALHLGRYFQLYLPYVEQVTW